MESEVILLFGTWFHETSGARFWLYFISKLLFINQHESRLQIIEVKTFLRCREIGYTEKTLSGHLIAFSVGRTIQLFS